MNVSYNKIPNFARNHRILERIALNDLQILYHFPLIPLSAFYLFKLFFVLNIEIVEWNWFNLNR